MLLSSCWALWRKRNRASHSTYASCLQQSTTLSKTVSGELCEILLEDESKASQDTLLPDNVNKTWASRFACVGGEGRSEFDKEGRTLNKKTLACDLEDRNLFFSYTQILKVKVYKRALRHSTEGVEVIWLSFHCVCVCGERVHERKSFTERRKDSPSCSRNSLKRSIWISTSVKNLVCIN